MKGKPILLLDFDGVIHSYKSGWKGARVVADEPVPGALEFVVEAQKHFQVCVYSARSKQWGGKRAMRRWLEAHLRDYFAEKEPGLAITPDPFQEEQSCSDAVARSCLKEIRFPTKKPAAFLTIDDRAIQFKGTFPHPEEVERRVKDLLKFKPWYGGEV